MLEQDTRIGEFQIVRLLGKGGMGEVYEAQQFHPERRVALKVLVPWLAENKEALERFWREAEVPAKLDHPAVVRIYSTGKSDGVAFYVMQLVNGLSLAKLISVGNEPTAPTQSHPENKSMKTPVDDVTVDIPVTPPQEPAIDLPILREYRADRYRTLARLGIQAARALAWTHKKGYLHRDIKPSNIMVDHHGQLYLLDFGLTRALESGSTTRMGSVVGTPYYMSPEQAEGHPLDPRSDIFSLGVSLYQMATGGKGPYRAARDDSDAVLREVRSGGLLPLKTLAPDIPPMLEAIIERALDPRPLRRYQKAEELADDLEKFLNPAAPGSGVLASPAPRWAAPRWILAATAGLLLLAAGGYLIATAPWRREEEKKEEPEKKPQTLRDFFKRDRPVNTPVRLLRADNQPDRHKPLLSKAVYTPMSKEIVFICNDKQKPGLFALDDPGNINFEYSVEMKHWDQNKDGRHDVGIFFGWREPQADPLERPRFFSVHIDPRTDNNLAHGRLLIGTWRFDEPMEGRIAMSEQNPITIWGPKDGIKGIIPLPPPKDKRVPYYRVYVRVIDKRITVGVEDEPPVDFDASWILNADKRLRTYSLDPHGAVGIWTRNGQACFRNITVTALPKHQ